MKYPVTPDERYFVHRGRLWRCTNPNLSEQRRDALVKQLVRARRAVREAKRRKDNALLEEALPDVHAAKVALGERGAT